MQLTAFSQNKIVKIIDSNLYELDSGIKVRLAGIETPGIFHPDNNLRNIGIKMKDYVRRYISNRPLIVEYSHTDTSTGDQYVFLYRKYPLNTEFYNENMLKSGYGRHLEVNDSSINVILAEAEASAKANKSGIWRYDLSDNIPLDTISTEPIIKVKEITFGGVLLEVVGGTIIGTMSGLAGGAFLMYATGPHHGEWAGFGEALIGFYAGYIAGSSGIVYMIGKNHNPSVKYEYSLLSSLAGASVSIAFISSDFFNSFSAITALALPLTGSILYVNLADGPMAPDTKLHQDVVRLNSSYLELFRVTF
jgi:endonuclease YncB( thermonuclease family)